MDSIDEAKVHQDFDLWITVCEDLEQVGPLFFFPFVFLLFYFFFFLFFLFHLFFSFVSFVTPQPRVRGARRI